MQLGELQSQYQEFLDRGVSVVALSVDPPAHSIAMTRRMGLKFSIASDEDQIVMQAYGVQNPSTRALALHAVFIVDENRKVFYRKVASRRPVSQELLDAIDYETGHFPARQLRVKRDSVPVAFPRNNFQALITLSTVQAPLSSDVELGLTPIFQFIRLGQSDDATIAFRSLAQQWVSDGMSEAQMLSVSAHLVNSVIDLPTEALLAGRSLAAALDRLQSFRKGTEIDSEALEASQKDLDLLRALIRNNAARWKLRSAKTMLRSYRELSLAALR